MKKNAFTMIELIFVIIILGILAGIAIPRYFSQMHSSHTAILIDFTRTLNRTTGVDLWSRSLGEQKGGSIKHLVENEDATFLSKYVDIPKEINASDVNLSKCGDGEYKTIITANPELVGEEYNITCKDGTLTTAPYFRLIRVRDGKILVSRD